MLHEIEMQADVEMYYLHCKPQLFFVLGQENKVSCYFSDKERKLSHFLSIPHQLGKCYIWQAITKDLGPEVVGQLKNLVSTEALIAIAGILGFWLASHAVRAGQIADIILVGVGVITLGLDVIDVIKHIIGFAKVINARTEQDIDTASGHLADAIAIVGIEMVLEFLLSKVGGMKTKKPGADDVNILRRRGTRRDPQLSRLSVDGGHQLIITHTGKIYRCSSCQELSLKFAEVLAENPELARRLDNLQQRYQRIVQMDENIDRIRLQKEADGQLRQLEGDLRQANRSRPNSNQTEVDNLSEQIRQVYTPEQIQ